MAPSDEFLGLGSDKNASQFGVDPLQQDARLGVGGLNLKCLAKNITGARIIALLNETLAVSHQIYDCRCLQPLANRIEFEEEVLHCLEALVR